MTNKPRALDELLPCPFCGGEASGTPHFEDSRAPGCYITCHSCDCSPDGCYRPADEWPEAVRVWNTRAAHSLMAAKVAELVRLFPEAFDVLTRQEMRDAKGNWRSLIDQQTKALAAIRAALETQAADIARLREALVKARHKFDFYEQCHRLKCTAEGDEKADRNRELVEMIDAALATRTDVRLQPTRDCLVTPEMAAAGAEMLAGRTFGESLTEIVTDVFYTMQGKASKSPLDTIASSSLTRYPA